jgi:hypothetical protein
LPTTAQRLEAWIWIWISHHTGNCFSLEVKFRSPESSLFFFLSPPRSAVRRIRFHFARAGSRADGRIRFLFARAGWPSSGGSTCFVFAPAGKRFGSRPEFAALFRGQLENERVENFGDISGGCCSMHPVPRGSCEGGFAGSEFSRFLPSVAWLLWFCVEKPFVDAST